MRLFRIFIFVAAASAAFTSAQTKPKKHSDVFSAFDKAHYVYVQAMDGDIMKPSLYPEDREAISDVQDGVRDWDRYSIATRREDADLVFMVRKGRAMGAQDRVDLSRGQPTRPNQTGQNRDPGQFPEDGSAGNGTGIGVGTEVGPSDDILRVYLTNPDGKLVGPIWTRQMRDGLDEPSVPLLRQLQDAVEKAYPKQPAPAPKHP